MLSSSSLCVTVILALVSVSSGLNLNHLPGVVTEPSEDAAYDKWRVIESNISELIDKGLTMLLPQLHQLDTDISDDCVFDLTRLVFGIRNLKLWAFKVLDAMGKPVGGNLVGTTSSMGSYQECLDVEFPKLRNSEVATGQYCLVDLTMPLPPKSSIVLFKQVVFKDRSFQSEVMEALRKAAFLMYSGGFRIAICLPSTCQLDDVNRMVTMGTSALQMNGEVYSCEAKQPLTINGIQWAVIISLMVIVLLNIIGSLWDILGKKDGWPGKILGNFSTLNNSAKILNTECKQPMSAVDGLRVISTTWVILGHTFASVEPHMLSELLYFGNTIKKVSFQPIVNSIFAVESFYLITAIIISFNVIKSFDSTQQTISTPLIILRRIFRLLPCVLLTMGLFMLWPLLGSGPMWKDTTSMFVDACRANWWKTVLFINNYLNFADMCLPHSWYIAVEFQCFLLSLLYLKILFWSSICGKLFLMFIGLSSVLASGLVTFVMNYPATITISIIDFDWYLRYLRIFYSSTYVHVGVYAIGLYAGTYLARHEKPKWPKWFIVIGWLFSGGAAMALVYSTSDWNAGVQPSVIESAVYAALCRTVWAISIAWVITACALGYGGPVNTFLSWRVFGVLATITYPVYLLHIIVVYGYAAALPSVMDSAVPNYIWIFFGNLCITGMFGFVITVIYEAPVQNLTRLAFSHLNKLTSEPTKEGQNSKL